MSRFGTSNKLFMRGFYKVFFKVTVTTPFFMIGPFCPHHSICLTLGHDMAVFYGNDAFSFLVYLTEKR